MAGNILKLLEFTEKEAPTFGKIEQRRKALLIKYHPDQARQKQAIADTDLLNLH